MSVSFTTLFCCSQQYKHIYIYIVMSLAVHRYKRCKMTTYIRRHPPRRVQAYICHFPLFRWPIHQSRRDRRIALCFSALLHLHTSSYGAVHLLQASQLQTSQRGWRPSPFAPRLLGGSGFRWQVFPPRSSKMHHIPSTRNGAELGVLQDQLALKKTKIKMRHARG